MAQDKLLRKLPVGIQDFQSLREEGYLYVDKTGYIYSLVHQGKPYFLSRPRRFGKSLLLSAMRYYWEGKRELFKGLAVERLEANNPEAWKPHPVFYFDFNKKNFTRETALEEILVDHLSGWEAIYGNEYQSEPLEERFQHLIQKAVEMTGEKAVILVDEYDKPLFEVMTDRDLEKHNKAVFKGFFSALKSYDHYLKFVFLTGVTKFSKVSIFSDLNQLNDISLDLEYSCICGITEQEMRDSFEPEIQAMAKARKLTEEECFAKLKTMYDGYHFSMDSSGIYNPFSLLNALSKRRFGAYWFSTGTPTFLIDRLKTIDYDIRKFTDGRLFVDEADLTDYRYDNPDPVPLFYQTGYLTIQHYDEEFGVYGLGYPNDEVRYGFLKSLVPYCFREEETAEPLDIRNFVLDIREGRVDGLRDRFVSLFARLPYTTDDRPLEQNFQNVIYIVFMLMGQYVRTEVHSAKGRADVIAETDNYIYLFEFKRDASAKKALQQIEEKGYAKTYAADGRKLYRIGVKFDSKERTISEWEVAEESCD